MDYEKDKSSSTRMATHATDVAPGADMIQSADKALRLTARSEVGMAPGDTPCNPGRNWWPLSYPTRGAWSPCGLLDLLRGPVATATCPSATCRRVLGRRRPQWQNRCGSGPAVDYSRVRLPAAPLGD